MARIFYVDSINGLNTNDGLTPSTAFADPFVDVLATISDPVEFWIRQGSAVEIGAVDKVLKYSSLVGWPRAEDPAYDVRPSTDWDNDTYVKAKVVYSTDNTDLDMRSSYNTATVANIEFEYTTSTVGSNVRLSYGDMTFDNCSTVNHTASFISTSGSGDAPVTADLQLTINGLVLGAGSAITVVVIDAVSNNYLLDCKMNDCVMNGISVISNTYGNGNVNYPKKFLVTRCTVSASSAFTYGRYQGGSSYRIDEFRFVDSNIITAGNAITYYSGSNYHQTGIQLKFSSHNTEFDCGGRILHGYTYSSTNYGFLYLLEFTFIGNTVHRATDLVYMQGGNADTDTRWYFTGISKVFKNTLNLSGYLFRGTTTNAYQYHSGSVFVADNEYISMISITGGSSGGSSPSTIMLSEKNLTTSGSLFEYGGGNAQIKLVNSTINGHLGDHGTSYVSLEMCYVNSLADGGMTLDAKGSTIVGAPAINNLKNVVLTNCIVRSATSPLMAGAGSLTMIDCEVDNDFSANINGTARCYNSIVNGVSTAFISTEPGFNKTISAVYRQGGSNGTVRIEAPLAESSFISFDNVTGSFSIGTGTVSMFISGQTDLLAEDVVPTVQLIGESGGLKVNVDCTITVDSSSQWDGITVDTNRFVITADVSSSNLDDGSEFYFFFSSIIPAQSVKDLYIDLDAVQLLA